MDRVSKIIFIFIIFFHSTLSASSFHEGKKLAKQLNLVAGYKAMAQWERVFQSKRKMKRYKIDTLSPKQQAILKEYLINHAIDSDHPTVAGEF